MKLKLIVIGISIFVLSLLIAGFIKTRRDLTKAKAEISFIQNKSNLEIGKAQTTIADANKQIKKLNEQIQSDIAANKATLISYAELEAKYNAVGKGKLVIPGPTRTIFVSSDGPPKPLDSLPFEFKDFRLQFNGDAVTGKADYKLTQKFELIYSESLSSTGNPNQYAELYELDPDNKRIGKLNVTKFNVTRTNPNEQSKFRFWDPRLDISLAFNLYSNIDNSWSGDLGLSLFSYGKQNDLSWRFLRFGAGVDKFGPQLNLSPVLYNIANPLPLINNLWIIPRLGYNITLENYFIGIGIGSIL